jgi:hypothetical protein
MMDNRRVDEQNALKTAADVRGLSSTIHYPLATSHFKLLLTSTLLLGLCGASCPKTFQNLSQPMPRVLPPNPTVEQVVDLVNRNCSQIQSFSTNRAWISGAGFPSLGASIAFERPRRFRLRASTSLTGPELDLGSNDDVFWFWVRRNEQPGLYFCRHDQFDSIAARQAMPIDPSQLIEALGVTGFDPTLPHQLTILPNDRLRIDTIRNTSEGPVKKVTILDGSQGWVLEQHLYDAQRRLVASSVASQHRRDPLSGLVMPKVVVVRCPTAQFSMQIDLGNVEINRPGDNAVSLWTMPTYPGAPAIDLANPPPSQSQVDWRRTPR